MCVCVWSILRVGPELPSYRMPRTIVREYKTCANACNIGLLRARAGTSDLWRIPGEIYGQSVSAIFIGAFVDANVRPRFLDTKRRRLTRPRATEWSLLDVPLKRILVCVYERIRTRIS